MRFLVQLSMKIMSICKYKCMYILMLYMPTDYCKKHSGNLEISWVHTKRREDEERRRPLSCSWGSSSSSLWGCQKRPPSKHFLVGSERPVLSVVNTCYYNKNRNCALLEPIILSSLIRKFFSGIKRGRNWFKKCFH